MNPRACGLRIVPSAAGAIKIMRQNSVLTLALLLATLNSLTLGQSRNLVRGIYGGSPVNPGEVGKLSDYGVNAVFVGSGGISQELISLVRAQGGRIFAEFNTMHYARYLESNPDAAPVGSDGKVAPAPEGWQGVCPNHEGYRLNRMNGFRQLVARFDLDGVWLDYHHAHASWERAEPLLPDTCFCPRCLDAFSKATRVTLPAGSVEETAQLLLGRYRREWIQWRCDTFTDWIREFREILSEERPRALLGTFHAPWSDDDFDGARLSKLAIDLRSQARYIDVFSPMPYHARFGHSSDTAWISRQVEWLGNYLGLEGRESERIRIWPIVQLSDWGETVPASQVKDVLEQGIGLPSTGVIVFAWGSLCKQPDKVEVLKRFYLDLAAR